ncbi:hypothetical protein ACFFLM_03645 [Deinococcus oregonensis]|uniref:Uncharacterized protein n=1 Tax=Deinococcus oregonensis TaxID=1805970 RepID=A0ABV6AUA5_9DEIO
MTQLHALVLSLGHTVTPGLLIPWLIGVNVVWIVILAAYGPHFQQVAGFQLLDLQNAFRAPQRITFTEALRQVSLYSPEARALYWPFFILDNIMPQLAFSSFAVLWAHLLKGVPTNAAQWFLHSPLLLLPLGVGFFDWFENLGYILAMHTASPRTRHAAMFAALTAKWIKAACLLPTFILTVPIVMLAVWY